MHMVPLPPPLKKILAGALLSSETGNINVCSKQMGMSLRNVKTDTA